MVTDDVQSQVLIMRLTSDDDIPHKHCISLHVFRIYLISNKLGCKTFDTLTQTWESENNWLVS